MKQSVFPFSAHPKLFWTTSNIVPTGTINHFPSKKGRQSKKLTIHPWLVPTLRMCVALMFPKYVTSAFPPILKQAWIIGEHNQHHLRVQQCAAVRTVSAWSRAPPQYQSTEPFSCCSPIATIQGELVAVRRGIPPTAAPNIWSCGM